jgi:hypothetical protein
MHFTVSAYYAIIRWREHRICFDRCVTTESLGVHLSRCLTLALFLSLFSFSLFGSHHYQSQTHRMNAFLFLLIIYERCLTFFEYDNKKRSLISILLCQRYSTVSKNWIVDQRTYSWLYCLQFITSNITLFKLFTCLQHFWHQF